MCSLIGSFGDWMQVSHFHNVMNSGTRKSDRTSRRTVECSARVPTWKTVLQAGSDDWSWSLLISPAACLIRGLLSQRLSHFYLSLCLPCLALPGSSKYWYPAPSRSELTSSKSLVPAHRQLAGVSETTDATTPTLRISDARWKDMGAPSPPSLLPAMRYHWLLGRATCSPFHKGGVQTACYVG